MSKFKIGDEVEWSSSPQYTGIVAEVKNGQLGVLWNHKQGSGVIWNQEERHNLVNREPEHEFGTAH